MLDRQPVLMTEALLLRPLRQDDFEALRLIAADPLLWEQHPAKDRTQEPVFRAWFEDAVSSGGALVAMDRRGENVIGTFRFVLRGPGEVEIGWTFLARSHWGGQWNGQMKHLMIEHTFASLPTVLFSAHVDNVRSQRAIERPGARRTGSVVDARGHQNVLFRLDRV